MERMRKRTPFLRWRAQLQTGCESSRLAFPGVLTNTKKRAFKVYYFMVFYSY